MSRGPVSEPQACALHQPVTRISSDPRTAVVFLHGILGTPDHFHGFYPLIPEDVSVYSLLLEGHGGSVSDFAHSSMAAWKNQVDSLLSALSLRHERIILAAHSMGTLFALEAAVGRPERIAGLFLLAVPLKVRLTPTAAWNSLKVALDWISPADAWGQAAKAACSITHTRKLWQYLAWLPRFWELLRECRRTRELLSQVSVPCIAFQSARDELVAPGSSKLLKQAGLPTEILPDSGHFYYAPGDQARFLEAFSSFLQ